MIRDNRLMYHDYRDLCIMITGLYIMKKNWCKSHFGKSLWIDDWIKVDPLLKVYFFPYVRNEK